VFRVVVLSIVLTLAVGPEVAVLCVAWCHPQGPGASTCHKQPSTAAGASHYGEPSGASSVTSVDDTCPDCENVGFGAAQFLREDVRRSASALAAVHACLFPRYQFAPSTTGSRTDQQPERAWSLEARSLLVALRI
jgi:hypothetical protein